MSGLRDCVLVVDDEAIIAELWCIHMDCMGLEVCATAATAEEAVTLAQEYRPALVLMDVRLQGRKDGVDAALSIHDTVGSKVIFITGSNEPETMARIRMDHPADILFKPISQKQLQTAVRKVIQS